MNKALLVGMFTGLCWSTPAMAEFYKCVVNGVPVYQSTPCAHGKGGAVSLKPITSLQGTGPAPKPAASAVAPAAAPSPNATGKPAAAATPAASRPDGSSYNSVGWKVGAPGYRMALAESKRTGAPVFVYFYADWCGYCKRVDSAVFPDIEVAKRMRSFIKVKVNPEKYPEDEALFRKLGGKGYPYAVTGFDETALERFDFGNYSASATRAGLDAMLQRR